MFYVALISFCNHKEDLRIISDGLGLIPASVQRGGVADVRNFIQVSMNVSRRRCGAVITDYDVASIR